jgi:excisionase family DNA binding protein
MNRTKSIEEHYSITTAARLLGVHRNTVMNWIASKRIPRAHKMGRTMVRISASALQCVLRGA